MRTALILLAILSILFTSCKQNEETNNEKTEYYGEKYRPQFHFSPDSMWMNDPNGMVYYEGEYHLFYQYYPDSTVWGPMHWGHAISKDLITWEHQPIALYPDSIGLIFSGSAVVDWKNTSGFGSDTNPPLVAIYTYHNMEGEKAGRNDYQTQGIAFSRDKGRTWTKYEGNPVLKNPGIKDFRDPKVVWHEVTQKWIMALAVTDRVGFYSSPNLIDWTHESDFGQEIGAHGGVWECPDLFQINVDGTGEKKWVLLSSINPGGPNGGSATQYFVGEFDGHNFISETKETKWLDWGKDNYAGVTWSDILKEDGRRLFIGWMSNWQYATVVPTQKWRSAMTIPRELKLLKSESDYIVTSLPVEEIERLRVKKKKIKMQTVDNELEINHGFISSNTPLEFRLSINLKDSQSNKWGVKFKNSKDETLKIGYDKENQYFFIDRRDAGVNDFSDSFEGLHTMPWKLNKEVVDIRLLYDVSSIELFADNGNVVMTELFFPSSPYNYAGIYSKGGILELNEIIVYKLKSIWE